VLDSPAQVINCLLRYADWWQPPTTSILQVATTRGKRRHSDGFRAGLLEMLDERTELCRRVSQLAERDRELLVLWYVGQDSAEDIAKTLRMSRRSFFRRRAHAIRKIVEFGDAAA
jgi:DNA-directed RNA polymerase specialized sigma subunit